MNTNHIKQLFVSFAQKLPANGMAGTDEDEPGPNAQALRGALIVRGNLVLREEAALEYMKLLDDVWSIVASSGTWSRVSVDDLLSESVFQIAEAIPDARAESMRTQTDRLLASLKAPPAEWDVDLAVAGFSPDCAGLTFGKLQILSDTLNGPTDHSGEDDKSAKAKLIFVRVRVAAIDTQSAQHMALAIADRHLAVLNALFSDWQPSRIHLYRGQPKPVIRESVTRTLKVGDDHPMIETANKITGTILSRNEWLYFMAGRGGDAVSKFLLQDQSYGNRLIAAYVTAGTACVEAKPQLAFLLFAIALESVILGKQIKTEITYQLSSRVAHLLEQDLESRRSTVAQVNGIYTLRSGIAHSGRNDVTEGDVYAIRAVCLRVLQTLATSQNFAEMSTVEELDRWFENRMLGAT